MIRRLPGGGWPVLLGGGEFSFGETLEADRAWVELAAAGAVAFLPTASGSADYGRHFAAYLESTFSRPVDTVPIYRRRDARRGKNLARLEAASAVYLGGGVADHLLDALADSPALETLARKLAAGGVVVLMAAAAQAAGVAARGLDRGKPVAGLGWLPGGVVEANFDPGHDRRLRRLLSAPAAQWGLGLPAGSAVLLGPEDRVERVGPCFLLDEPDGDLRVWAEETGT